MLLKLKYKNLNDSGYSLIEILISLIVLTIILLSIFGLIIQATKTGKASETIIDATYLAQTEMENAVGVSKITLMDERVSTIQGKLDYSETSTSIDNTQVFRKRITVEENEIIIQLEMKEHSSLNHLTPIIIKVFEVRSGEENLIAQMENILTWRTLNE
nr:prepilin-type N-terminal cleavage/methylation domain-containing protein [Lysinibacillus timonensis]